MKSIGVLFVVLLLGNGDVAYSQSNPVTHKKNNLPAFLTGRFIDDYGIRYTINDSLWTQESNAKYHIIQWNAEGKYLLVRNDEKNPSAGGRYTRIDYMEFTNMGSFKWGYCLTVYEAATIEEAARKASADRANPKTGCGGFPFSRMKKEK